MGIDATLYVTMLITLAVIADPRPARCPCSCPWWATARPRCATARPWQAPAVSFLVITVFAIAGNAILNYLPIGIPALQRAGGLLLLLLLVALQLLTGLGNAGNQQSVSDDVNVAPMPLGTPLPAGPGAVAAVIANVQSGRRCGGLLPRDRHDPHHHLGWWYSAPRRCSSRSSVSAGSP